MQVSPHFSLHELTYSRTAARHSIKNIPTAAQTENLRLLCTEVLEPLRALLSRPVNVNSGYRCRALNRVIGGARASQHQTGRAADIVVSGMSAREVFDVVCASELPFDQVIEEFGEWVHISFDATRKPRRSMLIATRDQSGGVKYTKHEPT